MEKQLMSLDDFNKSTALDQWRLQHQGPRPNGIACPKCGTELVDPSPSVTLLCNPPALDVSCPNCDFRGYRNA